MNIYSITYSWSYAGEFGANTQLYPTYTDAKSHMQSMIHSEVDEIRNSMNYHVVDEDLPNIWYRYNMSNPSGDYVMITLKEHRM